LIAKPKVVDRLTIRSRPAGLRIQRQHWGKLLFIHQPIPAESLRRLIPDRLEIDTFEGQAWIGVVPFTMWGIRPSFTPAIPGLNAFHELNVRTYVHLDGVPGVWFLSLDAANIVAVRMARVLFHLPYFDANMELNQQDSTIHYLSLRTHRGAAPAELETSWKFREDLAETQPGSLEFFLTERYCLYAAAGRRLFRCRIWHQPWPLRAAELLDYRSTMIESFGLKTLGGDPLVHYAESLKVDVWRLKRV
jgi:uncharacterized protein YqjF (DUF2071 family)